MLRTYWMSSLLAVGVAAPWACKQPPPPPPPDAGVVAKLDRIPRIEFNRLAAERALPIFWISDANNDGALDPAELALLWGIPDSGASFIEAGKFTQRLVDAYADLEAAKAGKVSDPAEDASRRATVRKELSQGQPTLLRSDFSSASEEDKAIVRNIAAAAQLIEVIHAKQLGAFGLQKDIPADDHASRMLFYRNQGPWCAAPATENDPNCSALPSKPKKIVGLYPAELQQDPEFCKKLAARKDGEQLLHQFFVVQGSGDDLKAVPYTEAYAAEMQQISGHLKQAAEAIKSESEAAFKTYLTAAAQSFGDNNWEPADEAWAKMNVNNSKWYLRIGPDEVYFEPCSRKAGFHVSFARINQDSLEWQQKLDPVKTDLEAALAKLAGPPYKARKVTFHLPDFIDIVINAGDSRDAHGGTIGQSLPNWGPVANEGRGRTVAMTNLYTDPDSKNELAKQADSLFCAATRAKFTPDTKPQVMSTVLHEAAHNLGPAHEYKVKGKTASQIFGGPMGSMLEELKSQTAALYFTDWLAAKGLISNEMAETAHVRDLAWAFGHISRGMYDAEKKPKPYSQLAGIQFGFLMKEGALNFKAEEKAANGADMGCYELDLTKYAAAAEKLMGIVAKIKGSGDKKGAEALVAEFIDAEGAPQEHMSRVKERWLRAPRASFVYSVVY